MTTWQPQQSARPESQSSIALGALTPLAVVGSAIAFMTVVDRRQDAPDTSGLGVAISAVHDASVELKATTAALRDAADSLQQAARELGARTTTVNVMDLPPPATLAAPVQVASDIPIKCAEAGRCTLSRAFLEAFISNPSTLARQARVMPSVKDGHTRGFKFYGIRPASLPQLIGFKNGDLLTAVNGAPLTSMDAAMGLYSKLRVTTELRLDIERKGEPMVLVLTIE